MPFSLRFAPYRDLATEIAVRLAASRAGSDALAPFDEEVIVSSGGLSHTISRALLEILPDGVAGLRTQSLESLAQRVVNAAGQFPRVASDAERRLAMRTAIRMIPEPLFESRGVAAMLERSYRDVRDSGISIGELSRRAARGRGLRDVARTRLIVRAWQEYEVLIARLRAIDPADLLGEATRLLRSGCEVNPQLLAGFYDMTGVQFALVEALRERGKLAACFVPVDGSTSGDYAFAHSFTQRMAPDAEVSSIEMPPSTHLPELLRFDTRLHEIEQVCVMIGARLRSGQKSHTIAVTARSFEPYDFQLLERGATSNGFVISVREEIPLTAQRIGRAAVKLLRIAENGFPRGDVFELLRDGLRVNARISIDRSDESTRRAGIAGGTSAELRTVRSKSPFVADYVTLVAELEELTSSIDQPFLQSLSSRFRIESEVDARAAEAIDQVAALFRRAAAWRKPFDLAAVIDALEQCTVAPIDLRSGNDLPLIWTGDVMKLRGRAFDDLYAIRSEDGILPQRRNEDPLLPDSDRRLLGVREIGGGDEEERLLFRLMLDSALSSVQFTSAVSDGFGKALRPSRYVRDFPQRIIDRVPVEIPAAPRRRALQLIDRAGQGGAFDGYIANEEIRARIRTSIASLTPTQLEDFGECPQKFFLKHILGVRDIDDPDRELQIPHREKGILDHSILEQFYRELTREEFTAALPQLPRLAEPLASRLERIIAAGFDRLDVDQPAFNRAIRAIERTSTRRILRDFIIRDLDDLGSRGHFPIHFEYRFGSRHLEPENVEHPEPFIVTVRDVPVRIEGTIDRIDRGGEDLRVIDYKAGKALRHDKLENKILRGLRLQLPLYAMAASEFFNVSPDHVSGAIKPMVFGRGAKHEFTLAETRAELLATLELFVGAILDGWFPTYPGDEKEIGSCKYCPVRSSCRTKHDAEESRTVRRHKDPRSLLTAHRAEVE